MDVAGELVGAAGHSCRVCGKSFRCGRSLGGHMRSHLALGSGEADVDGQQQRAGYGLRENPKKTRRLSDLGEAADDDGGGEEDDKACLECGRMFASWRSLFGHMRRHAASGAGGHDRGEDVGMEIEAAAEEEFDAAEEEVGAEALMPREAVVATAPRRRRRSMRVAAPAPALPPVLSGFEKEQEDVALCLMMLSRDTGLWTSTASAKDEPLEEEKEKEKAKQECLPRNGYHEPNSGGNSALPPYGDAKIKTKSSSKSKKQRTSSNSNSSKQCAAGEKRSRYECPGCGKAFHSYQALGGHRASHKRINSSCCVATAAAPDRHLEPSVETNASFSAPSASPNAAGIADMGSGKANNSPESFECPVCSKLFASRQALGGHKRSHLIAATACSGDRDLFANANGNATMLPMDQQQSMVVAGFLDLNLPAPSYED